MAKAKDDNPDSATTTTEAVEESGVGMIAMHDHMRLSFVFEAIQASRPGNKRGGRAKMWTLNEGVLLDVARRHIIGGESAHKILGEMSKDLPAISGSMIDRWLHAVRKKYNELDSQYIRNVASKDVAFAADGRLEILLERLVCFYTAGLVSMLRVRPLHLYSNAERHWMARSLEMVTNAAKVQGEVALKRVQTEERERKLRAVLEDVANARGSLSTEEIGAMLTAVLTGAEYEGAAG